MVKKCLSIWFIIYSCTFALNFEPLPKSFTHEIMIIPEYRLFRFASINLGTVGGSTASVFQGGTIGIKWGNDLSGLAFFYGQLLSSTIYESNSEFVATDVDFRSYKCRYYFSLIEDHSNMITGFISIGQYFGQYSVDTYGESTGQSAYLERFLTGYLVEYGVLFGYKMNPEWNVYLSVSYQSIVNNQITNPVGNESSDPSIDFQGASMSIGNIIHL